MAQNYGLDYVWPNLSDNDISNLQFIPEVQRGVSNPKKGYNEFVLYGEDQFYLLHELNEDWVTTFDLD